LLVVSFYSTFIELLLESKKDQRREKCDGGRKRENRLRENSLPDATIGKYSLHETANENDLRLIAFALGRQMAIRSTYFMYKRIHLQTWHSPNGRIFNQTDHCMINERHFSEIIDVKAQRRSNIDSDSDLDHILVDITLRTKICRAYTTRQEQQRRRFAVKRLKSEDATTQYLNKLESEFQSAHDVKHSATMKFGMQLKTK
jgi:hypothetical protein